MRPSRDPRRGTRRSAGGARPSQRKVAGRRPTSRGTRGGGDDMDSRRYAPPPKKSNTPLIIGIAGGALVLIILVIAMSGSSGGSKRPRHRQGNTKKKTHSTKGADRFGGHQRRELTAAEKQKLAEASTLENEASAKLNTYFDRKSGSYSLKSSYRGQESMVLSEITSAISNMERRMAIMEELQNATGESFDEGNRGPRLMKTLRMVKRALK